MVEMNSLAMVVGSSCAPVQEQTSDLTIPLIDLSGLHQPHVARALVIDHIKQACKTLGCFQVKNHGMNKSVIMDALEAAADFFQLSAEEKAEFISDDLSKPVRYSAGSMDGVGDKPRAFLKHYAHPLSEWVGLWPHAPPDYREKMGKYASAVRSVALQLMDAILESLGLGQGYLDEKLEEGMQVLALNCYQQHSEPREFQLGLAPHSDYGCITILAQSCQGLQIFDRDAETWRMVPVAADALYVHIGDYLEVLSNGRYNTVIHRAVLTNHTRFSIASIHSLSMDEKVITAKELVDAQHPRGYRESSFRDFLHYISSTSITDGRSFIDSLRIPGA